MSQSRLENVKTVNAKAWMTRSRLKHETVLRCAENMFGMKKLRILSVISIQDEFLLF